MSSQTVKTDEQFGNSVITAWSVKGIDARQNVWLVSELVETAEEDLLKTTPTNIKTSFW